MFVYRVVIVQALPEIRQLLAAGEPCVLLSPPDFAATAGCGFWRALIAAAEREFPGMIAADILDCGDFPGYAMAALRAGCRLIVLSPSCPAYAAVAGAAETMGATVLPEPPA